MQTKDQKTLTPSLSLDSVPIDHWANEFYKAKKVENLSPKTLHIYQYALGYFLEYCRAQLLEQIQQITAGNIRNYLLWLEEKGHNPGGVHQAYRVLKTFLIWYDHEAEPDNWRNPIEKVKAPKISEEPLEPVEIVDVQAMVKTCDKSFLGRRNRAILLFLLDSGVRADEMIRLNISDVNLITGEVLVKMGKGRKVRTVVIGKETRKAVRAYLKIRKDKLLPLWILDNQKDRLEYQGLRQILFRHAEKAGIEPPALHDFRRAFAINMLRKGVDLIVLARLMGHTSLKIMQRYLKFLPDDLLIAHAKGSPVDNSKI